MVCVACVKLYLILEIHDIIFIIFITFIISIAFFMPFILYGETRRGACVLHTTRATIICLHVQAQTQKRVSEHSHTYDVHTHTHTHTHTHIHTRTRTRTHAHAHTHTHCSPATRSRRDTKGLDSGRRKSARHARTHPRTQEPTIALPRPSLARAAQGI